MAARGLFLTLVGFALVTVGIFVLNRPSSAWAADGNLLAAASLPNEATVVLKVSNLPGRLCCPAAVAALTQAVGRAFSCLAGISNVEVSFRDKTVTVAYDPAQTTVAELVAALGADGWIAKMATP